MTAWTDFVKQFAKDKNCNYSQALKNPACSIEYKKQDKFVPVQDLAGNFVPIKKDNITMEIKEIKKRGRPKKYSTTEEARKAKIAKTIAGAKKRKETGKGVLFDNIKKVQEKIQDKAIQAVQAISNTTKSAGNKVKSIATAIIKGREDYPPKVRDIISKYGDKIITGISLNRTPLGKPLMSALQVASGNTFSQKLENTPYDKLFHLFICVNLAGNSILLEKNEVINAVRGCKKPAGTESKNITSSDIPGGLTLNQALNKTHELMGGKFFNYSAKDNNCQDFIASFLKANNIGSDTDVAWVKQETKVLFDGNDRLRKIANTLTDIGARVDVIKQGVGIKKKGGMVDNNSPEAKILKALLNPVFTEYFTTTQERTAVRDYIVGLNQVQAGEDQGVVRQVIRDNWENLRQFSSNPNYPAIPPLTAEERRKRNKGEELTETRRKERTGAFKREQEKQSLKSSYRFKPSIKSGKRKADELVDLPEEEVNGEININKIMRMFYPEDANPQFQPKKDNNDDEDFNGLFDPIELGNGLKRGGMMNEGNLTPLTQQQGTNIIMSFFTQSNQGRLDALNNAIASIPGGNVRKRFKNWLQSTDAIDGIFDGTNHQGTIDLFMGLYDRTLAYEYDGATDTEGAGIIKKYKESGYDSDSSTSSSSSSSSSGISMEGGEIIDFEGGEIIDFEDMKWGSFSNQLKQYNKTHRPKLDLHSFAMMILANPKKFNKRTARRARFYVNVILKKREKQGGSLRDSVNLILMYIQANELQDHPQVVEYLNELDDNTRLSILRENISDDGDDIDDFADAVAEGEFTQQMTYDINRIVKDLINIVEEGHNTDYEDMDVSDFDTGAGIKSKKGGMINGRVTPPPTIPLTQAQGNSILNTFHIPTYQGRLDALKTAIQNIGYDGGDVRGRLKTWVSGFNSASQVRMYMKAYDNILAWEYDGNTDYEYDTDTTNGEGIKSSKVVPADKTKKVAPEPEYLPRVLPSVKQRQEGRLMAMEDPLLKQKNSQITELRNMLQKNLKGKKELMKIGNGFVEPPIILGEHQAIMKSGSSIKKSNSNTKMANSWITYVKGFAKKHNCSYSEALKNPACKAGYKKGGAFDPLQLAKDALEKAGEPFKVTTGINPATAGYDLGHDVIGPALYKAMYGKGVKGKKGKGMPTQRDEYVAQQYEQKNLGANGRVDLDKYF